MTSIELSLVIPIYNEEELIDTLYQRCTSALQKITKNYEIICIDDGSKDTSLEKMLQYHQKDKKIKIISLSRNFWHQAAYTAGLEHAKWKYVVMMDGDMQDPPELIEQMYQKIQNSNIDIVYGKRNERNENFTKKLSIKLFHNIFKNFSKMKEADNVGNFSMLSRKALESFLSLKEKNRYLPWLRFFIWFKQDFVEYNRPDREIGEAKMWFKQLFKLASDAIFSFSDMPIKICFYLGILGIFIFLIMAIYTIIVKITWTALLWRSSTILSIYFLWSVQLIFLGIIWEYIFRIYKETQNRPIYIINQFYE